MDFATYIKDPPRRYAINDVSVWTWQRRICVSLAVLCIFLSILGIYNLQNAPTLIYEDDRFSSIPLSSIRSIAGTKVDPSFFQSFPEFVTPGDEAEWWRFHRALYSILKDQPVVDVEIQNGNKTLSVTRAHIVSTSLIEVLERTSIIYLVAFIYAITALSVLQRHRSPPGTVLAFFFLASALYFINAAPIISRPLTLHPLAFRTHILALHTAAGGLITLVHFAFVFPEPKPLLRQYPWLPAVLYGYFGVTTVLYQFRITAFGTTFPFFLFWLLTIVGAFLHSLLKEEDPFLKKQISLSLLAPILACLFFVCFLLPGVLGLPQIRFTYFVLFSIVLPFALPLAVDNRALYQDRLALERSIQEDKERLQADLHDSVGSKLATICLALERILGILGPGAACIKAVVESVYNIARDASQEFRGHIKALNKAYERWDDFCALLRSEGNDIVDNLEFVAEITCAPLGNRNPSLLPSIRRCLYFLYREALTNVAKHAQATRVSVYLACREEEIFCVVGDTGVGFNIEESNKGHRGLANMQRRVEELGGVFVIASMQGEGTQISCCLPLRLQLPKLGERPRDHYRSTFIDRRR